MRIGIVGNNLYGQVFTRAVEAYPHATATAICPELGKSLEPFAADHNLKRTPTWWKCCLPKSWTRYCWLR